MLEALPVFKAGKWLPSVIPIACTLGEGYLIAKDYEEAEKILKEGVETFERCGTRFYLG